MKKQYCPLLAAVALMLTTGFAQEPAAPAKPTPPPGSPPASDGFAERLQNIIQRAQAAPPVTKFTLDFPGGTPGELVAAIEKASGKRLNVIVPTDCAATKLPALKMNNVDVGQLFAALQQVSRMGNQMAYGFQTEGAHSDDSIWCFFVVKRNAPAPPKVCRFYALAPLLERGVTVDDITTAIETGWKMLGESTPPTISFHKDTKLLIAVGEASKLETIDSALAALQGAGFGSGPMPGLQRGPASKPEEPKHGK